MLADWVIVSHLMSGKTGPKITRISYLEFKSIDLNDLNAVFHLSLLVTNDSNSDLIIVRSLQLYLGAIINMKLNTISIVEPKSNEYHVISFVGVEKPQSKCEIDA